MSDINSAMPTPPMTSGVLAVVPFAPPSSSSSASVLTFLASGTFRRILAFALGLLVPVLNAKFGWGLDSSVVVADVVLALGYITGSNANEAVQAHADAKVAAAQAAGLAATANRLPVLAG